MSNVVIVEVELDKQRHLRFDFNAVAAFERVTGKNWFRVDECVCPRCNQQFHRNILTNLSGTDMRALLYGCLLHEDSDLTLEQAGTLIHPLNVGYVTGKLFEVYGRNMPETDGTEHPTKPAAK